ncbi:nucleotide sugar dehydrogenase [Candidatus Woesearchaeota archaeon]|nr:nucleotide sugar dehydrogenase [Candidatus Woesearchaeota archaeon]
MKYILTNFAQGNAPFILCGHLSKKIAELSKKDLGVIFPLVYGEKQKKILQEELGDFTRNVFFDKKFGEILNSIFYSGSNFEEHLKKFVEIHSEKQKELKDHFKNEIEVETFNGDKHTINCSDIICEISRNPQIKTPIKPTFYTNFAFYSEILEESKNNSEIEIDEELLNESAELFEEIENSQSLCFMQQPNSFSYRKKTIEKSNKLDVPPFYELDKTTDVNIERGIYATITGIPGLEKFYDDVTKSGLKVYSSKKVENIDSEVQLPNVLQNDNILFHFCRSGWGSIAKSIITEKPIITLPYQKGDDPEIYFNNKTLKELDLAIFLDPDFDTSKLFVQGEKIKKNYSALKNELKTTFGTTDAFSYTAEKICKYLQNDSEPVIRMNPDFTKVSNTQTLKNTEITFNDKKDDNMSGVIDQIKCKKDTSIIDVMRLINEAPKKGAPPGLCLVTSEDDILEGIVTDGDIRRAILNYVPLTYPVEKIMTTNPITVPHKTPYLEMLQIVRNKIKEYQKKNRIPNSQIQRIIAVNEKNQVKEVLNFYDLFRLKETKMRNVCIIGLGYVGLTLGLTLADEGFHVLGIDLNESVVNLLKQKKSHVHEKGIVPLLEKHIGGNFLVHQKIPDNSQDIYVVCVGTPVKEGKLNNQFLKDALNEVGKVLKKDDLVVLRSTVSVGTCRELAVPLLEEVSKLTAGTDFFLAFTPERTIEGDALHELRTLPQIVGGLEQRSVDLASNFFRALTHQIITVNSLEEAEMVKLINNTFRDVTFAYSNELALICDRFNINTSDVIRAANEGYSRGKVPYPSPGVGGTCLKKDPHIFCESAKKVGFSPQLVSFGREINEKMVHHVVDKIKAHFESRGKNFAESKIFILGFAFKGHPETTDMRDSTTIDVVGLLSQHTGNIYGYDPIVPKEKIEQLNVKFANPEEGFKDADCVLIMNNHPAYSNLEIHNLTKLMKPNGLFFDAWNIFSHKSFSENGINYSTLGFNNKK